MFAAWKIVRQAEHGVWTCAGKLCALNLEKRQILLQSTNVFLLIFVYSKSAHQIFNKSRIWLEVEEAAHNEKIHITDWLVYLWKSGLYLKTEAQILCPSRRNFSAATCNGPPTLLGLSPATRRKISEATSSWQNLWIRKCQGMLPVITPFLEKNFTFSIYNCAVCFHEDTRQQWSFTEHDSTNQYALLEETLSEVEQKVQKVNQIHQNIHATEERARPRLQQNIFVQWRKERRRCSDQNDSTLLTKMWQWLKIRAAWTFRREHFGGLIEGVKQTLPNSEYRAVCDSFRLILYSF